MARSSVAVPAPARQPLLAELKREPSSGGVDYYNVFFRYIEETGPAGTQQALDEVMRRRAPELRGDLMTNGTNGEMLRREGRLQRRQQGRQEVGRRVGRKAGSKAGWRQSTGSCGRGPGGP